jgi:hypothetical protein
MPPPLDAGAMNILELVEQKIAFSVWEAIIGWYSEVSAGPRVFQTDMPAPYPSSATLVVDVSFLQRYNSFYVVILIN